MENKKIEIENLFKDMETMATLQDFTPQEQPFRIFESRQAVLTQEMLEVLGNGDVERGVYFLERLVNGLHRARILHDAEEWKNNGIPYAIEWLSDEVEELSREFCEGGRNYTRTEEESMDCVIVAARIFNREWESNE